MENKIKWGVIGSGGIARRRTIPEGIMHADHAILTSVYDINAEVNTSVAKEFNAKAVNSIQELYGSKGSILAKGTIGQGDSGEMIAYLEGDASGYNARQSRNIVDGVVINPAPVNTYRAEIEEFSCAILEKREPKNNITLGLQSQKILAACYESAKTRKIIKIN